MMRPVSVSTNEYRITAIDSMRILHLAAGNRWTGAAAPAFAEVEALRMAGVDAHYAYVGGYKLEGKLGGIAFAHPLIEKAQNPASFLRTVSALTALGTFDVVHTHLTYDHWLGAFVARRTGARLARTFHSARVLRSDPFSKILVARTATLFAINATYLDSASIRKRNPLFTPPPVDHRQFTPDGANVRAAYGIGADAPLVAVIGKLSRGRGFETALRAFAAIRKAVAQARMLIIGHGEHRPALENLAAELGITTDLIWAGYHEHDLAEHYRAADLLLFTERGSDEGHRAVLEAMACGVPPVTAPIEGMDALLGPFDGALMASSRAPEAIARTAIEVLRSDRRSLKNDVAAHSKQFGYGPAAQRLIAPYQRAIERR